MAVATGLVLDLNSTALSITKTFGNTQPMKRPLSVSTISVLSCVRICDDRTNRLMRHVAVMTQVASSSSPRPSITATSTPTMEPRGMPSISCNVSVAPAVVRMVLVWRASWQVLQLWTNRFTSRRIPFQ